MQLQLLLLLVKRLCQKRMEKDNYQDCKIDRQQRKQLWFDYWSLHIDYDNSEWTWPRLILRNTTGLHHTAPTSDDEEVSLLTIAFDYNICRCRPRVTKKDHPLKTKERVDASFTKDPYTYKTTLTQRRNNEEDLRQQTLDTTLMVSCKSCRRRPIELWTNICKI